MKRTEVKEVEEYYCDFCGCECTDEHYDVALPFVETNGYLVDSALINQIL